MAVSASELEQGKNNVVENSQLQCIFWMKRLDLLKGAKESNHVEQLSWAQPAKAAPKARTSATSYCYLISYRLTKHNPNTFPKQRDKICCLPSAQVQL